MLTLINTNRMMPPIAPIGLDYVAGYARRAGHRVEILDLCLANDPNGELARHFADHRPDLVGLSFRNMDDCFWPSAEWFLPELNQTVERLRTLTDSPIVLGGVGFSIFAARIVEETGADFGIRGDGEQAVVGLLEELQGGRRFDRVPGLVWSDGGTIRTNRPAWPREVSPPVGRDAVDNLTYFRRGGQIGLDTKRGCDRPCVYCADRLAKGTAARLRDPRQVADEFEALLAQGVDVLHLCDSEFNIPAHHAREVCDELIRRDLGRRVRWYAYLAVVPFDDDLARRMARAGCVGINFTGDSASPTMLSTYRQSHRPEDLHNALCICRNHNIRIMIDLLLGGPGETPQTVAQTIRFLKRIGPDCAGAALGVRIYPETAMAGLVMADGPWEQNPGIRRHYAGPIDLARPTFYIAPALGDRPATLVRELVAGDPRFFEPLDDCPSPAETPDLPRDHNYNQNQTLMEAIAAGARGAYWDLLRQLRAG